MECNVIKDLLPLYIDECCSPESAALVEAHLKECAECKTVLESMSVFSVGENVVNDVPLKLSLINERKASVLQSILLFAAFAAVTIGVTLEASSEFDFINGFWAVSVIVPSTGLLLSLANWYFVKQYKSKKSFSNCSCLTTLVITLIGCVWAVLHYGITALSGTVIPTALFFGIGAALTTVFGVLSKVLSGRYAEMLGKE